jgi:heptaprenylglyceryl phosphate synthase
MEKGVVKLVVFNGEDIGYWKNRTRNYLLSQGRTIWEIVQEAYVIPDTLDHATQGELQRYENNYKTLNLITTALGSYVYDRVAYLETAHDAWLTHMRALLRLSLHVEIPIIDSTRLFLRNLESP